MIGILFVGTVGLSSYILMGAGYHTAPAIALAVGCGFVGPFCWGLFGTAMNDGLWRLVKVPGSALAVLALTVLLTML